MKKTTTTVLIVMAGAVVVWAGCRFVRNDDLNQAALAGDSNRVAELLNKHVNVNGRGMHAMTPIMSAARGRHLAVAQQLVANGADVNGHNESGSTLMWAVDSENEDLVRYLLESGADVRWTNSSGSSALDFARERRKTNIVRVLEAWSK